MNVPVSLSDTAWPDLPERPLVVVPVGSTEQHGPHLPFDTDTVIAEAVSKAAAGMFMSRTGGRVVLAPAVAHGASGEHQGFPGTISIGHDALRAMLIELIRSTSIWAGRILFVNGHGGNVPTMTAVIGQMREEQHDVDWVTCAAESASDAHAGLDETSVMLYVAPNRVDMSKVQAGNPRQLAELLPQLMSDGVRAVTFNGILGDPRGATAERGAQLFNEMVDGVVASLQPIGGH